MAHSLQQTLSMKNILEMNWISSLLWLVGKFAISCSFMCMFVYASEIFPTAIRNICIGLCSLLARIGGIAAPYVGLLVGISYLILFNIRILSSTKKPIIKTSSKKSLKS